MDGFVVMQRRALRTLVPLALLVAVLAWTVGPFPPAAGSAAPLQPPTSAQRRAIAEALGRFRRAKDEAERTAAADRLLGIGPAGAAALYDAADRLLTPLLRRYRAAFLEATRLALRRRLEGTDPAELQRLQERIRALRADAGLTKERIIKEGDPALEELERRFGIEPGEVLEAAPALRPQRERLLALGAFRQRAADWLAEHAPDLHKRLPDPRPFAETLADHESLSVLLALARSDADRRILIENADLAARLDPEEARGIRRMNRIRILAGLRPLRIDLRLCDAARDHSKDMVEKHFFAHESPVPGKKTPWDRAKRFGTTAHAENIAAGAATGAGAIQMWWHSPGHHKNMMGDHSRVGLGRFRKTWTQLFG